MRKILMISVMSLFVALSAVDAHADLDSFMAGLNTQAKSDMNIFMDQLGTQFGLPMPRIREIVKAVEHPADAFMCLQLGRMTNKLPDGVIQTYKKNKKKGWGAIAKELGIKPGSAEFHALKRGDFKLTGEQSIGTDKGQEKGKSEGKNKGKDKGKSKGKGHKN
ncbi:hypothetical protein ACFLZM_07055 [Thermodesulfobacteriota bacterium]